MSSPKVPYVRLGNSGLKVSVPILGCMSYGSSEWASWVLDEAETLPIMKAAWDRGINTFDTANVYSNGVSEVLVGKFIEKYNIPRSQILIFSKCNGIVADQPGIRTVLQPHLRQDPKYVNHYGLSRASIFNAVDASLKRLNTSYMDLLQIHRFDFDTPVEETMKALHDLVQSGKVRYIGASSMRAWQFGLMQEVAEKNGWTKFVSMQDEISLLYREEEREMIPYCNFHGIGLIPWGPVAAGHLCRPVGATTARTESSKGTPFEHKFSEADKAIIGRVEELSKKYNKTMAQIALAWVQDKTASPIVGISSLQRLEESILGDFKLSEEDKKYLEEPYVPVKIRGHA